MRVALAGRPGPHIAEQPGWNAQIDFLPAPVEGWDTDSPVAELPGTRTPLFDNWMPSGTGIAVREGYQDHVTGGTAAVETLMSYAAGASSALFAAIDDTIYDVTSAGTLGSASDTGYSTARLSTTNITTSGGSYLWVCNGVDNPRHWNGSAWATPSLSITTYTDNDINFVFAFKERLFFIFKNTLVLGYLGTQAVAGTVSNFPLGAVFNYGGRLLALGSMSSDGGAGPDDYFVALTSEGEIAVYAGNDPSSSTTWGLVGVYYVGEPVGDRPFVDLGSDLGVITVAGLVSVRGIMARSEKDAPPLSARITTAWRNAATTGQGFNGWEGVYYPAREVLVINTPRSAATAYQMVRYRQTKGGWGRFTGWNFATFEVFGKQLYAGGFDGNIYTCFDGNDDNGSDIIGSSITPWAKFGYPGIKTLLEARPLLSASTLAVMRMVGRADFRDRPVFGAWPASVVTNAGVWDVTNWDECLWGGEDQTTRQWRAISGEGNHVALAFEARTNQSPLSVNGFDVRYRKGGQV